MSLFNKYLDRYSPEYLEHKKLYSKIVGERNNTSKLLLTQLSNREITIDNYVKSQTKNISSSKSKLKKYTKKKKHLASLHKFLGRPSLKFWIFVFGLVLLGFYFSIRSLINDLKQKVKTGHSFISTIGISVCLFWFYHLLFQTEHDFYKNTYLFWQLYFSLLGAFAVVGFVKYFVVKEGIISELINLVIRLKNKHYKKVAVHALYAERNDKSIDSIETVKDITSDMDRDISNSIKKIGI
jgi:hypothetical protein